TDARVSRHEGPGRSLEPGLPSPSQTPSRGSCFRYITGLLRLREAARWRAAENPLAGHPGPLEALGGASGEFARAAPIRSSVQFEAGPAANNSGPRAVLRRHAPSATRQRTLKANGIDCGAGPVSEPSSYAASGTARARLNARVGVQPDPDP